MKATIFRNASIEAFLLIFFSSFIILTHSGCDTESRGIIDSSYDTPYLVNFNLSPQEINTDTILVNGEITPSDSLLIEWDVSVEIEPRGVTNLTIHYRLTGTLSSSPLLDTYIPVDNSDNAASIQVNNRIETKLARADVGTFMVTASVETGEGLSSNKRSKPVYIYRTNSPPEIISVNAPDTLVVTETVNFEITVITNDPDGVDDVVRVHFMYTNPDGIQNPNPISLNKIEPGVFRSGFSFDETNTKGTHTFEFQAFDRMGEGSDVYLHTIEIQ